LLAVGALTWLVVLRARRRDGAAGTSEPTPAAGARARALLDEAD
jgi:hypothetical protein